jgi:transcriptional regulator with XRE-family HTH domain
MSKPSEMLWALVDPSNPDAVTTQSDLAERLGVSFQTVYRWARGSAGFTERRQREVAALLGLSPTHFSEHEAVQKREQYRQKVFRQFLDTDLGRSTTDEERRLLSAPRFDEVRVPTVSMYRAWLLVLRGVLTEEQLERALEERQRALDIANAKIEAQRSAKKLERSARKGARRK